MTRKGVSKELAKKFSRRLRKLMFDRGINPKELCYLMGVTSDRTTTVVAWLEGKSLPCYENIIRLRRAFDCDLEDLFVE